VRYRRSCALPEELCATGRAALYRKTRALLKARLAKFAKDAVQVGNRRELDYDLTLR
jgi:hypothetical protein